MTVRILAVGNGYEIWPSPEYVKACDVDGMDGYGVVSFTTRKEEALEFPGLVEALEFYRRQSTVRPLRDDGLPNRPLTALTVTFE